MTDFVHLHVHTEYSLLDGASRIQDVLDCAKELGMTSLAITDHGVMYGALDFYSKAKKIGIKPIIGCEVYVAKDRFDKSTNKYSHLILLAKDYTGYKNLMHLVSQAWTEGFYYKPRIDYKLLSEHTEGLICSSACLAGDIQRYLKERNYNAAKTLALQLKEMFGQDFYLEIMDHGIPEQREINPLLIKLSKETDIKLIATNDVHYTNKEDSLAQDVLECIQTGARIDDENRFGFSEKEFYLKSGDEMAEIFSNIPEAISNTLEVAEKCNLEIEFHVMHLPIYEIPGGYTDYEYLYKLAKDGLFERYSPVTDEIMDRFEYEITTIRDMGFVNYFLIVWDFINYARQNNIYVGPGRGSAAGSIVAYSLGITNIDPIRYSLLFERFLNPERVTMPDIDTDFCYERRGEMIDYVKRKYGEEKVAQIVTFGTLGARIVIRDVARVLNVPVAESDRLAKMVPDELKMTIDKALEGNPLFAAEYKNNEQARQVIDIAKRLEGMPRHTSVHAAGVVIADGPLQDYVPLSVSNKTDGVVAQYTMNKLEDVGLLKMDFLGLRTLTVIRYAIEMIEKRTGTYLDINKIPLDDQGVYDMISAGDTDGVFQLESGGMKNLMTELRPHNIDEVMVGISLFRPGPMDYIPRYIKCKNDPKNIKYEHPMLEPILGDTYGCMVYQEQVMRMVRDLAGYSMGRSDLVRRLMSKKKEKELKLERDIFINGEEKDGVIVEGALKRGVSKEIANELFDQMMEFAKYAFNKSHACAYAIVSYQTAYLKYYYKVEFWCALLNSYISNKNKMDSYISSIRMAGVPILPPDINTSEMKFTVEGDAIRLGFSGIANVGGAVEDIVTERNQNGQYKDFEDFIKRNHGALNKKRLECMILSGCFDSLGYTRAQLVHVYPTVLLNIQSDTKRRGSGQISLFDLATDEFSSVATTIPDIPEYTMHEKLKLEKEMTGMYLTGHPLAEYPEIKTDFATTIVDIIKKADDETVSDGLDGKQVEFAGIITDISKRLTKKKEMMARFVLEDEYAQINGMLFPKAFKMYESILEPEAIVIIKGKLSLSQGVEIIAESVAPYTPDESSYRGKKLYVRISKNQKGLLQNVLKTYPGKNAVMINIAETGQNFRTPDTLCVRLSHYLEDELVQLLGRDNVKVKEQKTVKI